MAGPGSATERLPLAAAAAGFGLLRLQPVLQEQQLLLLVCQLCLPVDPFRKESTDSDMLPQLCGGCCTGKAR